MKYFIGILITFFLATLAHAQQTIDKLKVKDLELPSESASRALLIDSSKKVKASSTVSDTELSYLDGVTSAIQTQLNGKEPDVNLTASRAVVSDGSGNLSAATTTSTEIGYVNGVTSAIQTQLNGKEPTITGAATTITGSNLTANAAVFTNASGKIAASSVVSDTELGYLDGVTSSIQTQLNALGGSFTPVILLASTNAGQTINTTPALVTYEDETRDTDNAYASGQFTVPTGKGGVYHVCASISAETTLGTNQNQFIRIRANSTTVKQCTIAGTGSTVEQTTECCANVQASAGQIIDIHGYSDVSDTIEAVGSKNVLTINRVE